MAKKSKEITFTQEELTSLKDLQEGYQDIREALGSMEVSRIQAEQRLETIENEKLRLETEYARLTQSEMDLVRELNEKYGPGNLDPNTGVFTPSK
jgi:predicted nuclease with TOPRIM domain